MSEFGISPYTGCMFEVNLFLINSIVGTSIIEFLLEFNSKWVPPQPVIPLFKITSSGIKS